MSEPFNCDGCGLCCKRVDNTPLDRGDGTCGYFDDLTNKCSVYEVRPLVCRVDKMYEERNLGMTWEEYKAFSTSICNQLKEEAKIP